MKNLILACAVLFAGLVYAGTVSDPQLLGRWKSTTPMFSGNGMDIYMGLDIQDSQVVASSICQYPDGTVLEAAATVPVTAGNGVITTAGSGASEVKSGAYTCNVNITPYTMSYTVSGGTLQLSADGKYIDLQHRP